MVPRDFKVSTMTNRRTEFYRTLFYRTYVEVSKFLNTRFPVVADYTSPDKKIKITSPRLGSTRITEPIFVRATLRFQFQTEDTIYERSTKPTRICDLFKQCNVHKEEAWTKRETQMTDYQSRLFIALLTNTTIPTEERWCKRISCAWYERRTCSQHIRKEKLQPCIKWYEYTEVLISEEEKR